MNTYRHIVIFSLLAVALMILSCKREKELQLVKFTGETQGTYYAVTCVMRDSFNLQSGIDSLLHRFDSSVSTYKANSVISRLNSNDTSVRADEIFTRVFNRAMEVSEATGGVFDVTVGPLVNAWGFGFANRLKVDQHVIDSLLPFIGYQKVRLEKGQLIKKDPRIRIDFNAIAQGYAVDVLSAWLESKGISSYLVDIGGEVLARGSKPGGVKWNVGIEKPSLNMDDEREVQDIVTLRDLALSTSGNYRKYYEENGIRYSHTINPFTGYPVKHSLLSVSVLANDCMTADAYATAFMVMGLEKAQTFLAGQKEMEAFFISSDSSGALKTVYTPGFEKILRKE